MSESQGEPGDLRPYEARAVPSGAREIRRTLLDREAYWRRRLGDRGYERALTNWQAMWGER